MSALETFEILCETDGKFRVETRHGVCFFHEVSGIPMEFGFHVESTAGDEAVDLQTAEDVANSGNVSLDDREVQVTHLATGLGVQRVGVEPLESGLTCARRMLAKLPEEAKAVLVEAHQALPGASALERGADFLTKQRTAAAKRQAEIDAKFAAYHRREVVFENIREERGRQDARWGEQNHPSLPPAEEPFSADAVCKALFLPTEKLAKTNCQLDLEAGTLSWAAIATEELCEAVSAATEELCRKELVQLAAVVAAWIECIDRRSAKLAEGGAS